jgi:hypothetical protein
VTSDITSKPPGTIEWESYVLFDAVRAGDHAREAANPLDMFNAPGERLRFDSDVIFETRCKLYLRHR